MKEAGGPCRGPAATNRQDDDTTSPPRVWAEDRGDHVRILIAPGPILELRLSLDPRTRDTRAPSDFAIRVFGRGDRAQMLEALIDAIAPSLAAVRRNAA